MPKTLGPLAQAVHPRHHRPHRPAHLMGRNRRVRWRRGAWPHRHHRPRGRRVLRAGRRRRRARHADPARRGRQWLREGRGMTARQRINTRKRAKRAAMLGYYHRGAIPTRRDARGGRASRPAGAPQGAIPQLRRLPSLRDMVPVGRDADLQLAGLRERSRLARGLHRDADDQGQADQRPLAAARRPRVLRRVARASPATSRSSCRAARSARPLSCRTGQQPGPLLIKANYRSVTQMRQVHPVIDRLADYPEGQGRAPGDGQRPDHQRCDRRESGPAAVHDRLRAHRARSRTATASPRRPA